MSKNIYIITAIRNNMNQAKTALTQTDLASSYGEIAANKLRAEFTQWKGLCSALWTAGSDYFLREYNHQANDSSDIYKAFKAVCDWVGLEEQGKVILPQEGESVQGWPMNVLSALAMGNDTKTPTVDNGKEVIQRMPTPCSENMFRGKFERWFVRALDHAVIRGGDEYRAYKAQVDALRKAKSEKEKLQRQTFITGFKAELIKAGRDNDAVEKLTTKLLNTSGVKGIRNPEKFIEAFNKAYEIEKNNK